MRRQVITNGTVTSSASTTLNDNTQTFVVDTRIGHRVEILSGTGIGQVREVIDNSNTQLVVSPAWNTIPPVGSEYSAYAWSDDWFRCRVTDVQRVVRKGGGTIRYDRTALL